MTSLRLLAFAVALALHSGVLYALLHNPAIEASEAFSQGEGSARETVVAEITLGTDVLTQEAVQASAASASAETKPEKAFQEAKTEEAMPQEPQNADPQPAPAPETPKENNTGQTHDAARPDAAAQPQQREAAASPATRDQDAQAAAAQQAAQRSVLWSAYQREIHSALERHKMRPRSRRQGTVLVSATISPSGELVARSVLKSSGVADLDNAALASLDRAAPFPPMPLEVASAPLTLSVPFQFRAE